MPCLIEVDDQAACTLDECIAGLDDLSFDVRDPELRKAGAAWLRRLGNNRTFLGDILLDELRGTYRSDSPDSAYSPQSIMLSGYRPGYFLRANIWPSASDTMFTASGAGTFAYGLPHDHNFDFLTLGYHGPGYESDYWEYDYERVAGVVGERAGLRFAGRRRLSPGTILHYRAHRDVHAQLPPESLSISINVMATDPAQGWLDQYSFDPASDIIAGVLNANSTETFLRLAVACGDAEAIDFAAGVGRSHPSDRLRLAAFEARADLLRETAEIESLWRQAERCGSRLVALNAAQRLAELA